MDVEFDRDFRFADTHVATGTGRVQHAWDEELLPHVRTLVQEDLGGLETNAEELRQQKAFAGEPVSFLVHSAEKVSGLTCPDNVAGHPRPA